MIVDADRVRRRRAELGLTVRGLAKHLKVTGAVVTRLESGDNHPDLPLGLLVRLAEVLAVDLPTLLVQSRPACDAVPDADQDARTVGAALVADGTLVPLGALAEAFDWTLQRTEAAIEALEARLPDVGMRVHRLRDQVAVVRAVEPISRAALGQLTRKHLHRTAISLSEARIVFRLASGTPPRDPGNSERVAIGVLANAGLLEPDPAGAAEMRLSEDVRFSLLLDEAPDPVTSAQYRGQRPWQEENRRSGRQATRGGPKTRRPKTRA